MPGADVDESADRGHASRPGSSSKRRVNPFAKKASRVVRALLSDPERDWALSELASEVQVDAGNAHRVLSSLLSSGLAERDRGRYRSGDPGSLLEAWSERAQRPRERLVLPVGDDLDSAVRMLIGEVGSDAVVSGELAAELRKPHLPARRALVHLVSQPAWEQVSRLAEDAPALLRRSGAIECDLADAGVAQFGDEIDGLPLAHPAQIYVDLDRGPGRGGEAAEHLRKEALGY